MLDNLKRGQFDISFGMIFSIILLVAIIAVASYVIVKFVGLGKCTEIGLFYNELEEEANKAWRSTIYKDFYESKLPSGIEYVCFGDLNTNSGEFIEQHDFLKRYRNQDANVFLYPGQNACDSNLAFFKLNNVEINGFFCEEVVNEGVGVKMEKNEFDSLVKLTKA